LEGDTFEKCGCHSSSSSSAGYHCHVPPSCLLHQLGEVTTSHSPQIGWAPDGFPIYGPRGPNGGSKIKVCSESTNTDTTYCLDDCPGLQMELPSVDNFKYRYYFTGEDYLDGSCSSTGPLSCSDPISPLSTAPYYPFTPKCYRGCCPTGATCSGSQATIPSCSSSAVAGTVSGFTAAAKYPTGLPIYSGTALSASTPSPSPSPSPSPTPSPSPSPTPTPSPSPSPSPSTTTTAQITDTISTNVTLTALDYDAIVQDEDAMASLTTDITETYSSYVSSSCSSCRRRRRISVSYKKGSVIANVTIAVEAGDDSANMTETLVQAKSGTESSILGKVKGGRAKNYLEAGKTVNDIKASSTTPMKGGGGKGVGGGAGGDGGQSKQSTMNATSTDTENTDAAFHPIPLFIGTFGVIDFIIVTIMNS